MWKKIKPYIIGIFTGIGAILMVLIGRRSKGTSILGKTDTSGDHLRVRQGFDDSRERLDELTDNNRSAGDTIGKGKAGISDTRKTVSELIRKGKAKD